MICEKCGKEFKKDYRKYPVGDARFCSRGCANSKSWTKEDKEKKSLSAKNSEKVKKSNNSRRKYPEKNYCKNCGLEIPTKSASYCRKCFLTCSEGYLQAKKKTGGYRENSGRGKSGFFKGYYCASTWELAYVIYLLDNNISFKRNTEGFPYIKKNGKKSFYIPDFIIDNKYVEVKGPQDINWVEKKKSFPYSIKVIDKKEIYKYISYVKNKYNIFDLSLLYEDLEKKFCKECGKLLYRKNKSGYCRNHVHIYREGPVD